MYKRQFVNDYIDGVFGNRVPTWPDIYTWLRGSPLSGKGPVILAHIRNRITNGPTWYDIPAVDVYKKYLEVTKAGLIAPEDCYFSLMAPTEKTLFQGEVIHRQGKLELYYSTIVKPMRAALQEGGHNVSGLTALRLLKGYLNVNSYEWLWHLLDTYDDHVIEFSTYSIECGMLKGFNTIYWEVRLGY